MKGILTNCITSKETEIELEYVIETHEGQRSFWLTNGVTGWESFNIDSPYTDLKGMTERGWLACAGTKGQYDKLTIPAEEMKKVLEEEGLI